MKVKKEIAGSSRPTPTRMVTRRQSRKVEVPKLEAVAEKMKENNSVEADEEMPTLLPFDAIKPKRRGSGSRSSFIDKVETLDLGLHNRTFESGAYEIPFTDLSDSDMGLGDEIDFTENDSIVAALHAGIGDGNILATLHTSNYHGSAKLDEFSNLGSYNADEIEACFLQSGSEAAGLSVNTTENSSSAEITPAEDAAFDDLIRQMSENYQVDVSVVDDDNDEQMHQGEDVPSSHKDNLIPWRHSDSKTLKSKDNNNSHDSRVSLNSHHDMITKCNMPSSTFMKIEDTSDSNEQNTAYKSVESNQRGKKRPFVLESGLSGSYWQIENKESSWAVRPRRSKAGSNMKSLIKSEKEGSFLTYNSDSSPKKTNEKQLGRVSQGTPNTSARSTCREYKISTLNNRSMERKAVRVISKRKSICHTENNLHSDNSEDDLQLITEELSNFCVLALPKCLVKKVRGENSSERFKQKSHYTTPSNQVSRRWSEEIKPGIRTLENRNDDIPTPKNFVAKKSSKTVVEISKDIIDSPDSLQLASVSAKSRKLVTPGRSLERAPSVSTLDVLPKSEPAVITSTIGHSGLPKRDEIKLISNSHTINATLEPIHGRAKSASTSLVSKSQMKAVTTADLDEEITQEISNHFSDLCPTAMETPEFDLERLAMSVIPQHMHNVRNNSLQPDDEKPCCSKALLNDLEHKTVLGPETVKEKENLFGIQGRSVSKTHKKWFEDEEPEVIRLGNNKLLINNKLVGINYTKYIREIDVTLNFDSDADVKCEPESESKALQNSDLPSCLQPHCRLGCVCGSLRADEIERSHCGRPRCFFGCSCLFKCTPTMTDDSDIRSRLRPRVSLLNWKELGRVTNDPSDTDFTIKAKTLTSTRKHSTLDAGLTPNRSKRNVQPPSRLRNEFIMDEGKRPSNSGGKISQIQKIENVKNENKDLYFRNKGEIKPPKQVTHRPVHLGGVVPLGPRLIPAAPQGFREQRKPDLKPKFQKPIISARYLYNHSLLRRMHKCGPCFVRLTRLGSSAPTQRIRRIYSRRQVAMKSTSKGSGFYSKNAHQGKLNQHTMKAANPLIAMKMREDNTYCIVRENGTILSFLRWSLRKECVPTAQIYAPISGDSAMYPWLKLPVPPMDQAWMFYELQENFKLSHHIVIPELRVVLRTKTLEARLRETEHHGKTQKLDVGDYTMVSRRNKYGTIYIVKNMPNILICGPLPKKRLKPLIKPYRRDTLDLLKYSLRKYPKIHKYQKQNSYNYEKSEDSDSDMIELDSTNRDWNLIPSNVMMKRYKDFMIHVGESKLPSKEPEGCFNYEYELDKMFGKERCVSPSDLILELDELTSKKPVQYTSQRKPIIVRST